MATYIKINENLYPATIGGRVHDHDWDNRESKAIRLKMTYAEATELFTDDVEWEIAQDVTRTLEMEDGTVSTIQDYELFDNSEFSILGDITVHNDGTVTVKMGKPTAEELLAAFMEG